VDVYLGAKQRGDADNFLKCGVDALVHAGVMHSDAYADDSRAIVHKDDRDNPRTEYTVTRME
jgi:Holliday junction resolvase RusA-like endonuclease